MGAASSVRVVYKDAVNWLRQYFDTETYMKDFEELVRVDSITDVCLINLCVHSRMRSIAVL